MPKITKTQRWLDLIAYLVGRRLPVEVGELMERLPAYAAMENEDSRRRVFERDKREIRAAGIPLDLVEFSLSTGEREEGYRLSSGDFFLPYVRLVTGLPEPHVTPGKSRPGTIQLAPEDARDALSALARVAEIPSLPFAEEARSAYAKLALDLDLAAAESPVLYAAAPESDAAREHLGVLTDALLERRWVRFRYHGAARGSATERRVAPYGLFVTGRQAYLVGHDEGRSARRTFRLGRMEALEVESKPAAYEVPPDFRLRDHTDRQAWELGDDPSTEVLVRFDFPRSLWAERAGHGELAEELANGGQLRRFRVRQTDAFLRWVLSQAGEARVVAPDRVRSDYERMVGAVAALYAGEGA